MVDLAFRPGVVLTESDFSQEGRFVDMDKVRFLRGRPQKLGGNTLWADDQLTGTPRALVAWDDYSSNHLVGAGTECKLYVWDQDQTLSNITPAESTGTLTDPFDTTDTSTTVVVTDADHGLVVGQAVFFDGADAVGGITIDGEYAVAAVNSTSEYTIEHTSAATSTANGGGSVDFVYELECGLVDATLGGGYGIGPYGEGTYGTVRTSSNFRQEPRMWALEIYDDKMLAMPNPGELYQYDPDAGGRAAAVTNAPTNNRNFFVTDDHFIVILGAGGDPMRVRWCDQDDNTVWTAAANNTAGGRTLSKGSRLITGTTLSNNLNLVWSDLACYRMQYRGSTIVFDSRLGGTYSGIIGPKAFTTHNGQAFWMGIKTFHMYDGTVRSIPNAEDVLQWVNDNLDPLQDIKTYCGFNPRFNEVWWWFVPVGETEPRYYVAVNMEDYSWIKGTMSRTAYTTQETGDKAPLMASSDGYVYLHEQGVDDNGAAMSWYLEYAPFRIGDGRSSMDIDYFFPDFERQVGNIDLRMTTHDRPELPSLEVKVKTLGPYDGSVDARMGGRYIGYRMTANEIGSDFRMGRPAADVRPQGDRP